MDMQIFSQQYSICRNISIVTSLSVQILWPKSLGHVLLTLKVFVNLIEYGVEMGNVSQRQKRDQRVKKNMLPCLFQHVIILSKLHIVPCLKDTFYVCSIY